VSLRVRVQPRSSREEVTGMREGALLVRLTAPPVAGQANAALVRLLARILGLPVSSVVVRQGRSGRDKVVELTGADLATVQARLSERLEDPGR